MKHTVFLLESNKRRRRNPSLPLAALLGGMVVASASAAFARGNDTDSATMSGVNNYGYSNTTTSSSFTNDNRVGVYNSTATGDKAVYGYVTGTGSESVYTGNGTANSAAGGGDSPSNNNNRSSNGIMSDYKSHY